MNPSYKKNQVDYRITSKSVVKKRKKQSCEHVLKDSTKVRSVDYSR